MSHSSVKLSFGLAFFEDVEATKSALDTVASTGVKEIDTAHMYGGGQEEDRLGAAGIGDGRFVVSSKNQGGWQSRQALLPENIAKTGHASLEKLKIKQLDIFYVHGPDRNMTLDEWVPSFHKLYEDGVYKRFGISNFSPEEVQELYDYCLKNNYVLPSVYQGNYNAVSRKVETTLFPVLRKLKIAFYAYSPLAGGFLAKNREAVEAGVGSGRWAKGADFKMYKEMYIKPSFLNALDKWGQIAEAEGTSKAILAYRWIAYHSPLKPEFGDTLILGASKLEQIENSVAGIKQGPLKLESAKAIEDIWHIVEKDAYVDNYAYAFADKK